MAKNAVIYARVSTTEQKENGFSIKDQVARLRQHCKSKGWNVIKVIEEDYSAKTFNRPAFQAFLEALENRTLKPDIFLCVRPDRFSRNMMGTFEMIKHLSTFGVKLEFIEQNIDSDNPEDMLLQAIYFALPEIDNKRRSQNVKRGMRQAKREGRWMGTPLRGYSMIEDNGTKLMQPNEEAAFIIEIFETFSKGLYNMEEVRRQLREKGFETSNNQFKKILSNISYTGKLIIPAWKNEPEEIIEGLHKGIISEKLFNKVQDILTGRRTQPTTKSRRNEKFPLRGHLQCVQCGNKLTGSGSKGRSGKKHYYYHCQKGCKERFKATEANELFEEYLDSFTVPDEILTLYYFIMEDTFKKDDRERNKAIASYKKQIATCESRLENLEDSFYDLIINEAEYKRAKKRYDDQLNDLLFKSGQLQVAKSSMRKYLDYGFALIRNLGKYYGESTLEVKQKIIGSIFPEKLIFSNNNYRTAKSSKLLSLITMNINELGQIKKDFPEISSEKSYSVAPRGIEPLFPG